MGVERKSALASHCEPVFFVPWYDVSAKSSEQKKKCATADVIMIKGNEYRLFDWIWRLKAVRHCKCNYLSFFISIHFWIGNIFFVFFFYFRNHCMHKVKMSDNLSKCDFYRRFNCRPINGGISAQRSLEKKTNIHIVLTTFSTSKAKVPITKDTHTHTHTLVGCRK